MEKIKSIFIISALILTICITPSVAHAFDFGGFVSSVGGAIAGGISGSISGMASGFSSGGVVGAMAGSISGGISGTVAGYSSGSVGSGISAGGTAGTVAGATTGGAIAAGSLFGGAVSLPGSVAYGITTGTVAGITSNFASTPSASTPSVAQQVAAQNNASTITSQTQGALPTHNVEINGKETVVAWEWGKNDKGETQAVYTINDPNSKDNGKTFGYDSVTGMRIEYAKNSDSSFSPIHALSPTQPGATYDSATGKGTATIGGGQYQGNWQKDEKGQWIFQDDKSGKWFGYNDKTNTIEQYMLRPSQLSVSQSPKIDTKIDPVTGRPSSDYEKFGANPKELEQPLGSTRGGLKTEFVWSEDVQNGTWIPYQTSYITSSQDKGINIVGGETIKGGWVEVFAEGAYKGVPADMPAGPPIEGVKASSGLYQLNLVWEKTKGEYGNEPTVTTKSGAVVPGGWRAVLQEANKDASGNVDLTGKSGYHPIKEMPVGYAQAGNNMQQTAAWLRTEMPEFLNTFVLPIGYKGSTNVPAGVNIVFKDFGSDVSREAAEKMAGDINRATYALAEELAMVHGKSVLETQGGDLTLVQQAWAAWEQGSGTGKGITANSPYCKALQGTDITTRSFYRMGIDGGIIGAMRDAIQSYAAPPWSLGEQGYLITGVPAAWWSDNPQALEYVPYQGYRH